MRSCSTFIATLASVLGIITPGSSSLAQALVPESPAVVLDASSNTAMAADEPAPLTNADTQSLEGMAIVAQVPVRTGDVDHEENTSASSQVKRQDLERNPNSLASVLASEPGIQHRQSGGFGSFSSLSIRAASSAQTAVYLDGILLNTGSNPVVDFSTLELLNLDSVDIYRGSTPLQLGDGAIGGAVNLNTRQADSEPETRIRLGIGNLSQRTLQLSHLARYAQWDTRAAISYRRSDNDFYFINNNGTPLNSDDDRREKRFNAYGQLSSTLLRTSYVQNENSSSNLTLQLSQRELGVPEWRNKPDVSDSYDTQTMQLQASQVWDVLANWNSRSSLYWHQNSSQLNQVRVVDQRPIAQRIDNNSHTVGAKTYWEYLTDSGTVGLSLDVRRETFDARNRLDALENVDGRLHKTLASLHYAWFDTSGNWSLTPALRWQGSNFLVHQGNANSDSSETRSSSNTGLQLGMAYRVKQGLSVTSNIGSYFREPSFGELYGSSGLVNGNPALVAEKGINLDAGVQYQTDTLTLLATAFLSERDELIVLTFNSIRIGRPANTGKARVVGLELSGEWALTPAFEIRSNLTLQSSRNLNENAAFYGKSLPGEAGLSWSTRLQYQPARAAYWYAVDVLQDRYYDTGNNLSAQDSETHSIGVDWKQGKWQGTLGIHNLGDVNVEDFNGFPKPGRTWTLSISRSL